MMCDCVARRYPAEMKVVQIQVVPSWQTLAPVGRGRVADKFVGVDAARCKLAKVLADFLGVFDEPALGRVWEIEVQRI